MRNFSARQVRAVRLMFSAGACAGVLIAASSASAQFYATQAPTGDIAVVDANGASVEVVTGDPVGERPSLCPSGAYHVVELPTDTSQLVLTDCASGQEQYSVEFGAPTGAAAE